MSRFLPGRLMALPAAAALILVLAGCEPPTIGTQTAKQQDLIGPVRITTPIEGCSNGGADNVNCGAVTKFQALVGYRVPAGVTAPATLPSSAGVSTTFRQSSSYASELQRLAPAPAGEQWIGYISDQFDVPATTSGPNTVTLAPDFALPAGVAGGTFTYRTVTGSRNNTPSFDPTRAVVCNLTDLTASSADTTTVCLSDPISTSVLAANASLPTNELTLAAGAPPSVHPGDTATLPFVATLAGPALSSGSFALGASSAVPGGTAAPGAATLAPAPGANATSAVVTVPASAPAGDYPVTLTATSGGQSRQATGAVHVLALPPLSVGLGRTASVKAGKVSLPITCPATALDPCAGSVSLTTAGKVMVAKKKARKRVLKLGSASFSVPQGKTATVSIKLPSPGVKALSATGKLKAKATFAMKNRAGAVTKQVRTLTLKQVKPRKKHHK